MNYNFKYSKCTCWWELPPCLDDRRQESARPRPVDEKCTSTSCSVEHPCFDAASLDKLLRLSYTPVKYHQSSWNKRPMGHIAHLRKQFKSLNTYDYIITLIKRRKKTVINICSLFEETWIPFTQGCFLSRLFEIGSVVLEKRIV